MPILYAIHAGYVMSKKDKQMHFINAEKLIRLYDLNPRNCIKITKEEEKLMLPKNIIHLYPDYTGEYKII
jgi:hypothetical protein